MKTIYLSFFLLIFYSRVVAQSRAENFEKLFTYLSAENNFNGSVLVADSGKVIFSKSYGFSNFETKDLLNENSMFDLASVSKQFTAAGILLLMQEKKLSLNDSLNVYFPELPYKVTIKNLLNHTSGIPDYMKLFNDHWDKSKIAFNKDVISLLSQHKPVEMFNAGDKYEYSNTGYVLLASVIEKISGISYASFLQKSIFEPLEMHRTRVYNTRRSVNENIPNYAYGYLLDRETKKAFLPDSLRQTSFVIYLDGIAGDGTVNSTVYDLFRWDRALYTNKLLNDSTLKEMYSPFKLNDNTLSYYGYGWELEFGDKSTGNYVYHSGSWPGYGAYINRFIQIGKTIIVLRNLTNQNRVQDIPMAYIDILFNKPFKLPLIKKP